MIGRAFVCVVANRPWQCRNDHGAQTPPSYIRICNKYHKMTRGMTNRNRNTPAGKTKRPPTIVDVASLAGVSKSTVSNVVRDADCVAPAMRDRVTKAIKALGYRPNVLARQLVQQRTTIIGAVVGDLANPFHAEMAKQVEHHAAVRGYRVMFVNTYADKVDPAGIETLLEYRVAGILFLANAAMPERMRLLVSGLPVVFVACSADWGDVVSGDDYRGAEDATRYLLELGHRRIAYLADPNVEDAADRARRAGYRAAMVAARLQPTMFRWSRSPQGLMRNNRKIPPEELLFGPQRLTAIFSSNDLGAIELIDIADRLGIRVPEELSVVGFDDILLTRLARINLTTVAQPQDELAEVAIETLARRINKTLQGAPVRRTVQLSLVRRGSTASPASLTADSITAD
jgi:LacI family transcriptional regulator